VASVDRTTTTMRKARQNVRREILWHMRK